MAIIEVGLGGRLDATNVLTPLLTITTDISYDHVDILGRTLSKIAKEKAGIIKTGTPHLYGLLPEAAVNIIKQTCQRQSTTCETINRREYKIGADGKTLNVALGKIRVKHLKPSLPGRHQLTNCALALKAASMLNELGLRFSSSAVIKGVRETNWPGRFQIIRDRNRPTIVLDVCHNEGGARSFAETFKLEFPGKSARIVAGFVKKKEHQKIINALATIASEFTLVPMKTKRTVELKEFVKSMNWHGVPVNQAGTLRSALRAHLKVAGNSEVIAIVGSHYLVGEFLEKSWR